MILPIIGKSAAGLPGIGKCPAIRLPIIGKTREKRQALAKGGTRLSRPFANGWQIRPAFAEGWQGPWGVRHLGARPVANARQIRRAFAEGWQPAATSA